MALKIYESRKGALSFAVRVDGRTINIRLSGGYDNAFGKRQSYFSTSNKKIQDAIEGHYLFGKKGSAVLYLEKVIEDKVQNVEETTTIDTVTEFEHVKTLREAQEVLELNFKVEHSDITTKAKLFAVANKLNVKFPNFN